MAQCDHNGIYSGQNTVSGGTPIFSSIANDLQTIVRFLLLRWHQPSLLFPQQRFRSQHRPNHVTFTALALLAVQHCSSMGARPSDSARLNFVSANEIDYNVIVESTGSWSVQVVNGSQTSNLKYFTVNTPPTSPTGSLVVNLSPSGIGAQWQVDGTGYNNGGQGVGYITPGQHQITFKAVSGYTAPANQSVTITANTQTTVSASYTGIAPSTYTLTLSQGGSQGYIANSPFGSGTGNIYNAGSLVQLTANANTGYHFTGWSGDASGTANQTIITMNGNKKRDGQFRAGDPTLGTIVVNIQPSTQRQPACNGVGIPLITEIAAQVYTTFPGSYFISLHPVDGWISPVASDLFPVTLTAGQTTDYNRHLHARHNAGTAYGHTFASRCGHGGREMASQWRPRGRQWCDRLSRCRDWIHHHL